MRAQIKESIKLLEMLPDEELIFANQLIKKLVLAWDPDFTKLTAQEKAALYNVDKTESYSFDEVLKELNLTEDEIV